MKTVEPTATRKACPNCDPSKLRPHSEFYRRGRGLASWCKACTVRAASAWRDRKKGKANHGG